jgi:hypothetical protein
MTICLPLPTCGDRTIVYIEADQSIEMVRERSRAMTVRIGPGLAEFPFSSPRAFWLWIELCEAGGAGLQSR